MIADLSRSLLAPTQGPRDTCSIQWGCTTSHVLAGEERLRVSWDRRSGDVTFSILSYSRPRHLLSVLTYPVVLLQQRRFARDATNQADLHHTAHISLADALAGFELELKHLDGHKVKIGAKDITRPFQVRTFKGQGLPRFEEYSKFGDMHVTYEVDFPKNLSADQKAQLRKLLG